MLSPTQQSLVTTAINVCAIEQKEKFLFEKQFVDKGKSSSDILCNILYSQRYHPWDGQSQ